MTPLSRRRFLTISAATAVAPTLSLAGRGDAQWTGIALGAGASMRLAGLSDNDAAPIFAAVERELNRLEQIFSLYRPTSQISHLNQTGSLSNPAPELLEVLSLCSVLHAGSDGAFDPTVQPLWMALAQGESGKGISAARAKVGWHNVTFDQDAVRFRASAPKGMALTLNGIAQGAITDRIVALLRAEGLQNVLVDMGEIAAIGTRQDGTNWRVGIVQPEGQIVRRITLRDRAIATSAPDGHLLNPEAGLGHIINPDGPDSAPAALVSVAADSAVVADGLSTALCLLPQERALELMSQFSGSNPVRLI
jgi:FAD:protein FMN transferase